MSSNLLYADNEALITHMDVVKNVSSIKENIKNQIIKKGDRIDSSVQEQLKLVDGLSEFNFGKFLLMNRGINGFWTSHMVLWPKQKFNFSGNVIHPLEKWLLEKAPTILATQQRFVHFQKLLQKNLKNNTVLASIPCGMMDDLLTLDFSNSKNIQLVGIDLDAQSIEGAKENAAKLNLTEKINFIQKNAWELNNLNEFDVITSNGLNIYEPEDEKVVLLYKKFYSALKPKGILISSFLTPPPTLNSASSWNLANIDAEDLRLQKVIFSYILSAKWQSFRTEAETIK